MAVSVRFRYPLYVLLIVVTVIGLSIGTLRAWYYRIPRDVKRAQSALREILKEDPTAFAGGEGDLDKVEVKFFDDTHRRTLNAKIGNFHVNHHRRRYSISVERQGYPYLYVGTFDVEDDGDWVATRPECFPQFLVNPVPPEEISEDMEDEKRQSQG